MTESNLEKFSRLINRRNKGRKQRKETKEGRKEGKKEGRKEERRKERKDRKEQKRRLKERLMENQEKGYHHLCTIITATNSYHSTTATVTTGQHESAFSLSLCCLHHHNLQSLFLTSPQHWYANNNTVHPHPLTLEPLQMSIFCMYQRKVFVIYSSDKQHVTS